MAMNPTSSDDHPDAGSQGLQPLQIALLKIILGLASCLIPVIWIYESQVLRFVNPIDLVAYPTLICLFVVSIIALQLCPKLYNTVALSSIGAFIIYYSICLQAIIYGYEPVRNDYNVAGCAQWFPLLYTTLFMFMQRDRAMITSMVLYGSILLPTIAKLFRSSEVLRSDTVLPVLMQMMFSHPFYITALIGVSTLQISFAHAEGKANAMSLAANTDFLTQTANRRATDQVLQQALVQAQQTGTRIAAIFIDIDHFKQINDTFGHEVGDQVLVAIAGLLKLHLRYTDTLGRWGGEEFIIIVTDTTYTASYELAKRLCQAISNHPFALVDSITASFGVALSLPEDSVESLINRADKALYQAKHQGRNQVAVAVYNCL